MSKQAEWLLKHAFPGDRITDHGGLDCYVVDTGGDEPEVINMLAVVIVPFRDVPWTAPRVWHKIASHTHDAGRWTEQWEPSAEYKPEPELEAKKRGAVRE